MLDEVNREEAGRHGGVLEPGEDRDSAVEVVDGLGARCSAGFYPLPGLSQEAVDGTGADCFEFTGGRIGHTAGFSEPDGVKVQHEEGGGQFSAGPVAVFPERFEHRGYRGVIVRLADPFFPVFSTPMP
jgi:hypothetical protein